jgi:hypothetical protein
MNKKKPSVTVVTLILLMLMASLVVLPFPLKASASRGAALVNATGKNKGDRKVDPSFGISTIGTTNYPTAKTVTSHGSPSAASIDTTHSMFGGASGKFVSTMSQYLQVPDSDDWHFGPGDFTVEFWIYWAAVRSGTRNDIVGQGNTTDYWGVYFRNSGNNFSWRFHYNNAGAGEVTWKGDTSGIAANTWYDVVVERAGGHWYVFENGTQKGHGTDSTPLDKNSGYLYVGRSAFGYYLNGWIDELRISKGIALYTGGNDGTRCFTPSSVPFVRDSYTVLLLHFDLATGESSGSTVFLDDVTTGQALFSKYALTQVAMSVTSMDVYSHAAGKMRLAIFTDSGTPSTDLCQTDDTAVSAAAWAKIAISGCGTLQPGNYWLGLQWNPGSSYQAGPSYVAGSSNAGYRLYITYGRFPPSGAGGTLTSENYSVNTGIVLTVVTTVSDIFVVNRNNFVNATVTDTDGASDIQNVTIQVSTTGNAQTFILKWDQPTNTFSKYSDPSGIVVLNAAGSSSATYSANGWTVNFDFKFVQGFASGPCTVVTKTMSVSSTVYDTETYTNLFNVGYVNRIFPTFDDGTESAYVNATPVMNSYGMTATFYVVWDYLNKGKGDYMSWSQAQTLISEGYELGCHSRSHTNMDHYTEAQLVDQIMTVKSNFWTQHGMILLTFALPGTSSLETNSTIMKVVDSAGYLYVRSGLSWAGKKGEVHRAYGVNYTLPSWSVDHTESLSDFESSVNRVYDDWELIVVYHGVTNPPEVNDVTPAEFAQQMSYLYNKGFTTLPMSQVGSGIPITFLTSGLPRGTTSGAVLTVNGTAYTLGQFPVGILSNSGDPQTVAASASISSGTNVYAFTSWGNADGLSSASGTYTTPSSAATVTANYQLQTGGGPSPARSEGSGIISVAITLIWYTGPFIGVIVLMLILWKKVKSN